MSTASAPAGHCSTTTPPPPPPPAATGAASPAAATGAPPPPAGAATGTAGATGATERVSVSSGGAQGNGESTRPAISGDGALVAFDSGADRHANFGQGRIDPDLLAQVVRDAGAPVVCETPGPAEAHVADFAWLRGRL